MLCKGSPELGKSAGKGSPELGASGSGTLFMCQETCLSAVPSAGKGDSDILGTQLACPCQRLPIRGSIACFLSYNFAKFFTVCCCAFCRANIAAFPCINLLLAIIICRFISGDEIS